MSAELKALDLIRRHGDVIERHLFEESDFANYFSIYPEVWARFVLPNRLGGSVEFANAAWAKFCEHHYSCIVRCQSVREAYDTACHLTSQSFQEWDAQTLLDLHDALFGFFAFAAAAIENLAKCFQSAPGLAQQTQPDRGDEREIGSANWFLVRRNSLVHEMIVPVGIHDGVPRLCETVFQKHVGWHKADLRSTTTVGDLIEQSWAHFIRLIQRWESQLLDALEVRHPKYSRLPNLEEITPEVSIPGGAGSGAPYLQLPPSGVSGNPDSSPYS
ncbi:MAG: hypothetical protein J0L78_06105 [Planctomycetes bacterium]|nr:hypothetical protein [Planctomycetota bacterium]